MSHLYKKYASYSEYLEAKDAGEFNGITYSIATFPNSNEVNVYFLKENTQTNYLHYDMSDDSLNHDLAYWTANKGANIEALVKRIGG